MKIFGIFLSTLLFLGATNSFACGCLGLPRSEEAVLQRAESADLVLIGKVQETVVRHWLDGAEVRGEIKAQVRVLEGFVGIKRDLELKIWTTGLCGAPLRAGNSYLFFSVKSKHDGRYYASLCDTYQYTPRAKGAAIPSDPNRGLVMQAIWTLRSAYAPK